MHYADDPNARANLSRVYEAYNEDPTSIALAALHGITTDMADHDFHFVHNQITGRTNLWDDPTVDHRGEPQRQVQFDNGVLHTQYDPTLGNTQTTADELKHSGEVLAPTLEHYHDTEIRRLNNIISVILSRDAENDQFIGTIPTVEQPVQAPEITQTPEQVLTI